MKPGIGLPGFLLIFLKLLNNKTMEKDINIMDEMVLVNALCQGNQRAYNELYKLYSKVLLTTIKRIVVYEEVAEDLLQDTFVKVLKYIDHYNPVKAKLNTWISCLAKNTALDYQKSKMNRINFQNIEMESLMIEVEIRYHTSFNTDGIGLKKLTYTLSPTQQRVIKLVYFNGYTHDEAAKELSMPLGTVKSAIRLGIVAMRKLF